MSELDDRDPERYTEALRRYVGSGDPRMAQAVFDRMREAGVAPRREHYQLLLGVYTKARDLAGAGQVFEQMQADGFQPDVDVYAELVLGYARSGRAAAALEALDGLVHQGLEVSPRFLPAFFSLTLAAGRPSDARGWLRRMTEHGQAAQPAEYQRLIDDCLQRRAIKDARALVELMVQVDRPPTPDQVTALVRMMARAGHPDRARDVLERAVGIGVQVDSQVYDELLLAYATTGRMEDTEALVRRLPDLGLEIGSLERNAVLASRLAAEDVSGAWESALGLAEAGNIPTSDNLDGLYDVTRQAGLVDRAYGVLDWMLLLGVQPAPQKLTDIVGAFLEDDRVDEAHQVLVQMLTAGLPVERRQARALADGYVKSGRLDEARRWLDLLATQGTLTHGKHYGPLLSALVRGKRGGEAREVILGLLDRGAAPPAAQSSAVVLSLVKAGQLDEARELLGRLKEAGVSIDEPDYRELMWAFARKGDVGNAQVVYELMVGAGITPDRRHEAALRWASGETRQRLGDGTPQSEGPVRQGPAHADESTVSAPHEPAPGSGSSDSSGATSSGT